MNHLRASLLTIGVTLTSGVQSHTQHQMTEILLPRISPECTERTKLIIPRGSNWNDALKGFTTCSSSFTIKVLPNNTLEITDGTIVWIGKLGKEGGIEKIK